MKETTEIEKRINHLISDVVFLGYKIFFVDEDVGCELTNLNGDRIIIDVKTPEEQIESFLKIVLTDHIKYIIKEHETKPGLKYRDYYINNRINDGCIPNIDLVMKRIKNEYKD